jgi:fused signal recognition particle receptor
LKKIHRVISPNARGPYEQFIVLDATSGLNALVQAREPRCRWTTGLVLTKLDGTAKGGIVVAIAQHLKVPIVFVGLGEARRPSTILARSLHGRPVC